MNVDSMTLKQILLPAFGNANDILTIGNGRWGV